MFKTSIQPDGTITCTEKDGEKQHQIVNKTKTLKKRDALFDLWR